MKPLIMKSEDFYHTIETTAKAEFSDRGSKFIAYSFPVKSVPDFKSALQSLKKEHPKASHYCFAYRLGTDGTQFRVSDDGEPAGSAGRPILGQIDSKQLTDITVIVVRYFGGTLLGVPGLINAYKSAAALVLQLTPVVAKSVEIMYSLHFDYTRMNEVMTILKRFSCNILSQEMTLFCELSVGIPKQHLETCLQQLNHLYGVEVHPVKPSAG